MFIRRISPFDDLVGALRDFDGLFTRTEKVPAGNEVDTAWTPAAESYRRENEIALLVELPGVDPEKVQIDLTGNLLTVSGEKSEIADKQEGLYLQEIPRGRFSRSFKLPPSVRTEDVKASFRNGVLEVAIPLAATAVSRKIPLQSVESTAASKVKAA